ncbi:insulinase family protein [Sphingobacterium sp. SGG-5]|uniref:M16 family metallopeptidase n=1 Tax=Sphingobacterium sp. SGG-5 TaxID=2710881 RepID=UPI0013EA1633|nr:M16 family metallopeptidase [Sphingobacterium sp. SGG-5]NGM61328.1 insulinase family protein [Sphingobacterium sp. SGG-5]
MYKIGHILIWSYISFFVLPQAIAQSVVSPLIKGTLKNGMTYYVRANSYPAGEAVYRLFLKTGSLGELEAQRGLAHFLEHMAFNGSKHFPADSLIRFLEQQGAKFGKDLNAHTSYNETVYKLQLPSKDTTLVNQTLTILADWAGGLSLDSVEIEKERSVIYSEWLSRKTAGEETQDAFLNALLNGSRYADRKVIGDTAVILRAPAEQIRSYYRDWYTPSLMAVAVTGDVDAAWVTQRIKEKFSSLPANRKKPKNWPIPNYKRSTFKKIINDGERKAELNIIRLLDLPKPVLSQKDYGRYLQTDLLRMLLRRRFNDLSFKNPTYTKGSVQLSSFLNAKRLLIANVGINPDKPDSSIREFASHMAQLEQFGFDSNEIATVKKSYESALQRKANSTKPTPSSLLMDELYDDFYKGQPIISAQQEYSWYQKTIDQVDSVSLLREFQRDYDPDKAYYLLTGYTQIAPLLPSETDVLKWFKTAQKTVQPRYHKALDMVNALIEDIPSPATIVQAEQKAQIDAEELLLSNGVRVIFRKPVVERDRITVTGFRKGGLYALDSTDYITGLYAGQITALSGAGDINRESLSHYLTGNSASVRFLIDKTRSGIAGSAEQRDMETLFQLIYLKWTAPRVDSTIFTQVKEKAIDAYRHTNKTPAAIFGRDLGYLLNGKDYTTQEVTDTVIREELYQDRILPVFERAFGPAAGFTFIVIADPQDEQLRELVLTYLGGLPTGAIDTAYRYNRPPPVAATKFERNQGDTPKATVWLTYQTNNVPLAYHDYGLQVDMATAAIRTQLLKELREDMGMIYSIGVSGSATQHPNALARTSIRFSCKPEDAELLIRTIQNRLKQMVEKPESFAATLVDVKSNLRKEMELNRQKDSFWSSYIRNSLFNGEDSFQFLGEYDERLNMITAPLLAAFIRQQIEEVPLVTAILYPANRANAEENTTTLQTEINNIND